MTNSDIQSILKNLYVDLHPGSDIGAVEMTELPQAGGDRRYFRLSGRYGSCIGTFAPDANEARCFVSLAKDFYKAGCSVPGILVHTPDFHFYLQEDLGDVSLFSQARSDVIESLVEGTLKSLVQLQHTPPSIWLNDVMNSGFCRRQVMWDLNYFKYEFLKPSGVVFDEDLLENDFEKFSDVLTGMPKRLWGFMMRDCQSRNVMLSSRGPVMIDFQGGRHGPALYDAVSLLWQARAGFSHDFRQRMMMRYAELFCHGDLDMQKEMLSYLNGFVLFRTLQVLGAYGFRGLVQHRSHFILSIPGAVDNLRHLLMQGSLNAYPELENVCRSISFDERYKIVEKNGLTVEIFSFSYRKGYPSDLSGNGGGFMFDCRAMHNPGRYAEYNLLTGRDKPVVDFLVEKGEAQAFLKSVWSLTDPAVERYLSRGFSNLQIGFGCTGGQHRSVYCAEATARHIRTLFPEVNVSLTHREHP